VIIAENPVLISYVVLISLLGGGVSRVSPMVEAACKLSFSLYLHCLRVGWGKGNSAISVILKIK